MNTRAVAVASLVFLAGCGGGSSTPAPIGPVPTPAPTATPAPGTATLTLGVPRSTSSAQRAPKAASTAAFLVVTVKTVDGQPPTAAQVPQNPQTIALSTAAGGNCTVAAERRDVHGHHPGAAGHGRVPVRRARREQHQARDDDRHVHDHARHDAAPHDRGRRHRRQRRRDHADAQRGDAVQRPDHGAGVRRGRHAHRRQHAVREPVHADGQRHQRRDVAQRRHHDRRHRHRRRAERRRQPELHRHRRRSVHDHRRAPGQAGDDRQRRDHQPGRHAVGHDERHAQADRSELQPADAVLHDDPVHAAVRRGAAGLGFPRPRVLRRARSRDVRQRRERRRDGRRP